MDNKDINMSTTKRYIKEKDGNILLYASMSQEHAEEWLTSRGLSLSDHVIVVDPDPDEVQKMCDALDESVKTYADRRRKEYPEISDQLDKIYHEGIDAWKADMIKPIKDKYLKE